MSYPAIVGGSGLTTLGGLEISRRQLVTTPYGEPSGKLSHGIYAGKRIIFLPRHGDPHVIPPHRINYRANIRALQDQGITDIIAVNAVGGISSELTPGQLAVPDQLIDYTWGRQHTFFEDDTTALAHIDFTSPYSAELRGRILDAAASCRLALHDKGTYGVTQGPRLETAAEIRRLENDGCDMVGMTGLPEAALARELGIRYAALAIVVNPAAGKAHAAITMEMIETHMKSALTQVHALLGAVLREI